ncbi:MAG: glutathione S-transferase N-terminal domain-containing protein [Nitrosomonas sp.]|uniref:glutathione S-transferase N-terminal domain-containing protein n=1 Tax=Nitrosomonas sp. TaxID=42353 RepID=UPI0025E32A35|nr:glutathione S-transferase N-terminal domain-containing protein [Nitrosomonas sp.]MEB2332411.1 glutathione S-transferase N-terminal domain-containing protein [Nitrosomonas sp.]
MMTLYSTATCPFSHRCRIVLHEKDMDFQVVDVDPNNIPEDIAAISSHGKVPILIERDLVLYEANIINEYIDDRFPHPQLMPAEPVMRARARLLLYRFEKELFCYVESLEQGNQKAADKARVEIANGLTMIAPVFDKQKYILGDEYTMLDVVIAPLLWRLDHYGIKLPKQAAALLKYAERLFSRPLFIDALTPAEKLMRK